MNRSDLVPQHILSLPVYRPPEIPKHVLSKIGKDGFIHLENNEISEGPGEAPIKELIGQCEMLNRYPDPTLSKLRTSLSDSLGLDGDWLHFGAGIEEILTHITRAFIDENDEVLISEGTFPLYTNYCRIQRAKQIMVPLKNGHYDLAEFKRLASSRTRIIFLCNPNNPTGTAFSRKEFESFLVDLPAEPIIVLDEAYYEFTDRNRIPNGIDYLSIIPNLILLRTLSKAYGLARLRIGYSIQNPDLGQFLRRLAPLYSINGFAEAVGAAAILDQGHLQRTVQSTIERRSHLERELTLRGYKFFPSEANFLCIATPKPARDLANLLMENGVLVCPLSAFGLSNHIRVTIGKPEEHHVFLRLLDEVMNHSKPGT